MIYTCKGLRNLDVRELAIQIVVDFITRDTESSTSSASSASLQSPLKRQRRTHTNDTESGENEVVDIWKTEWGKMITHRRINDPSSSVAKKFRRRFRLPFSVFDRFLVPLCRDGKIFGPSTVMKTPIEFKILIALRILATGNCASDIEESSSIPENSCNFYFKQFVMNFAEAYFDEFVYFPSGGELCAIVRTYARMGFPMCCGSLDCIHVRLGKCPVELTEMCTDKKGYPSLAYQCVVGPTKRIFYSSDYFFGSNNDKTGTANDDLLQRIHRGLLKDVRGVVYDANNVPRLCKGGYFLVDGGYNKYPYLIDPLQTPFRHDERVWSECLENVRKNAECTFWMLKNRFRYFLNPIQHHKLDTIDAAWKCSCIFHNMLISYSGDDILEWESINPALENEENDEEADTEVEDLGEDYSVSASRCGDIPTHAMQRGRDFVACCPHDHEALKSYLVTHFFHQNANLG
mmetsp:Transcript_12943/g.19475  ORF Transcript_12943/g.19475 Transcript_12943/m.19475 type:complete len:461 (-) Transcript_12943:107-1489(-)